MTERMVFTVPLPIRPDDFDGQGHVNNVAFVRYVQEAALAHYRAAVPAELANGLTWVVRRHEVEYLRPGWPGEELLARTWIGDTSGATSDRHTEIVRAADAVVLVRARTVWVLLDATSGRPRRVSPEMIACLTEPT